MQSTANLPVIGLDLAKSVFQLHMVDVESGEIQRRQVKRAKLAEFFAKCQVSLVAMEACGTAHHWARAIRALGHQVKLLPAQHVKAFLLRDKTDAMDAQAIWVAAQQPHIKPVAVKTERQQACMALHGMRRQLMKMLIMQTNALRGTLAEFGIALPVGHNQLLKTIQGELALAQQEDRLPADLVITIQEQLKRIDAMQVDMDHIGQRLRTVIKEDRQMQAIQCIPGVGDLTASALVAAVGDFSTFKSGRQFASWVGLVPRQVGTGGKTQQLGISKRGDTYLRTLLIAGARAVIARAERSAGLLDFWSDATTTWRSWRWPTRWHARHGRFWRKALSSTTANGIRLSPQLPERRVRKRPRTQLRTTVLKESSNKLSDGMKVKPSWGHSDKLHVHRVQGGDRNPDCV